MYKKKIINIVFLLFFVLYFILNTSFLSHYGITWDEPEHYQRGNVYLQYFLTGDGNSFRDGSKRQSIFKTFKSGKEWMDFSYWIKNDAGHPPLNSILASLFNRILYEKLGILGDIESYHLFIILISVFAVSIVFFWTYKTYGLFTGIISFLSITLYPLFFAESHFNIKDPIEASFYAATLLFFYNGITKNNWKYIIISAIFGGLALGTKFNILFSVFTIIPWLVIYTWKGDKKHKLRKLIIACILAPFISFGILYATWPFLWPSPISNLFKIFSYYKEIGSITYQPQSYLLFGEINTFAIQWILYTTPLVILFFALIGILYSLAKGLKEDSKTSLFILFWFLIPVIRVSTSNAGIYGGVRQIMEYIPAMAILSGIGAAYIVKLLYCYIVQIKKQFSNTAIKQLNVDKIKFFLELIIILSFLPITLKLISIHPNENVYFNPLIGGLKGAKEKNISYWGNTFGNVYKQGVEWLNKNTKQNSKVARGVSYEETVPKIWFRKDIKYSNSFQSGFEKKGEYIIELTHDMPTWGYYYYYNYAKNMLKPLYEVKVDDVAILTLWKNDWENTKSEFKKEKETININNINKGKNYILIDIQKEILLTEVKIIFFDPNCHFTNDGYYITADSKSTWTNHPGNLGNVAFYKNFNPRVNKSMLSYIFPGIKTQFIKIIYSEDNGCFENIKEAIVKGII